MAYQSEYTGTDIDKGISLALAMYPVGSIYLSVNNVNPGAIFGGTWEQIQDKFLLAAGNTYIGGATGGTASHTHTTAGHTLTASEMPKHRHNPGNYDTEGSESGYKRMFTTNLDTGSDSVARSTTGSGGSRYAITATTSSDLTQTSVTSYAGESASHSHGDTGSSSSLPPYLAIYVWKRTA